MRNVLLAEPSFVGLVGLLGLLILLLLGGFIIVLLIRSTSKNNKSLPTSPSPPPSTQATRKCPNCGAELKSDVPEGLCPACLLQHGLATEGGAPPGTPPFTPPPLSDIAKLFPQLEILEPLGQGGMGAVYKARQPALDRFVALKILAPRSGGDLDFAGRFSREARALAKLSHPNIVGVYDFGQVSTPSTPDARPLHYFIMEYVDGPNLREVERAGKLTPREALEIIPQICAALQFAHDEGVVHRDIKPENVLLDKKGRVKIADFGLAKILGQETDFRLTGARDVMGTPHYMAPEQVEKPQEVDHRADIYSLGVVFYEMLTGELPLGKFDPPSHKVQIDVRLDDVVLRSLANNPDRRYQRVSDVQTEIKNITEHPAAASNAPAWANQGLDYRSKTTLFGLPLVHITSGIDPLTRKVRVSKGIIAIGGRAQGVIAVGGLAMGGLAIGGGAIGVIAMGGAALGLFSFGGLAIALILALGGGAIAPIAVGGGVIGYMAYGGGGLGAHIEAANVHDPIARQFFASWARTLVANVQLLNALMVIVALCLGVVLPLWLQSRGQLTNGSRASAGTTAPATSWRAWLWTIMFAPLLAIAFVSLVIYAIKSPRQPAVGLPVNAEFHYQVFECDAAQIARWVPRNQRQPVVAPPTESSPNSISKEITGGDFKVTNRGTVTTDASFAIIDAGAFDSLIKGVTSPPGIIVDEHREVSSPWWNPGMVNIWSYSRQGYTNQSPTRGPWSCDGSAGGFLGVRIKDGRLQIRLDHSLNHEPFEVYSDAPPDRRLNSRLFYEGPAPSGALVFLIPFVRTDGSAHYLVVAYQAAEVTPGHTASVPKHPEKTNPAPLASVETWSPTLEKPDLAKILEEAKDLRNKGRFEEALSRYIWYYNHEPEYGDPNQSAARVTSAIADWVELGRRYPKAKKALLEIRDHDVNEFTEGRGYADLFNEIARINLELQDEDSTYELFKAIRKGDPKLARELYYYVEALMVSRGEYQWCFESVGDPQARFANIKQSFDRELDMQKRSVAMQEQSRKQMEEWDRKAGRTNTPRYLPDYSMDWGRLATNRFVGAVGTLVEILAGSGHTNEAQNIRDEALTVMDDPHIKSAVADAEIRIQKQAAPPKSSSANLRIPSPVEMNGPPTNGPKASLETWSPTLQPGEQPDLMKIQQEATDLTKSGHYEESLQRHIWYHNHSRTDPAHAGVRNSFALSDWIELGRRYPKARQALLEIRDEDMRKCSQGEGYLELFLELSSINRELGDDEKTYTVFKEMAAKDKKLAQQCYSIVEGLLMSHGDYELCRDYLGDPQTKFERIRQIWEMRKKSEQQQEEFWRQMDQRASEQRKQQDTNGVNLPAPMPVRPQIPKSADGNFVSQVRNLIEILVATKSTADAEKIRDEAVLLVDDPRLKSAVSDAEEKLRKRTGNNGAAKVAPLQVQPPMTIPPGAMAPPPPPQSVMRPVRSMPINSQLATNASTLSPEEQVALIEIERIQYIAQYDPASDLSPKTVESVLLADQPPVVVETFPISGSRDVSPGETEVRVRFSKTMGDGSWSWSTAWEKSTPDSLGAPHYLADGRTCAIKVRLEPGHTYGWWLNSDKFHNFKDRAGRPAVPYLLIFQTKPD